MSQSGHSVCSVHTLDTRGSHSRPKILASILMGISNAYKDAMRVPGPSASNDVDGLVRLKVWIGGLTLNK